MDRELKYVLLGAAVRLLLAPFFMHLWDTTTILESTSQFLNGVNVYHYVAQLTDLARSQSGLPVNYEGFAYLPHLLFIYAPFYWLYTAFLGVEYPIINGHAEPTTLIYPDIYYFLLAMKLPVILADLAIIYLLARRKPIAGLLYSISPYSVMITSIWGNFDSIVGLLILASYLTFNRNKTASGLLYGLSLMKLYALAILPIYLVKLHRAPSQLARFTLGLAAALTPSLYFLLLDAESMLRVLLYHSSRSPKGLNIYNASTFLQGMEAQAPIARLAIVAFTAAIIIVTVYVAKRKVDLREGIVAALLTYLIFGPVTNEQHLCAVLAIALLCEATRIPIFMASHIPLFYALFNAKPTYFATPLFWSNPELYDLWCKLSLHWDLTIGPYTLQILYVMALAFAFTLIITLRRCLKTSIQVEAR